MGFQMNAGLNHETIICLGAALGRLGEQWESFRRAKQFDDADIVLKHYHNLVRYMMSTGWRGSLPPETDLPEEFMPSDYLEMIRELRQEAVQDLINRGVIKGDSQ